MRYVLDAAIALRWVLPEADAAQAIALQQRLWDGRDEFFAPDIFAVEIAHSLTRAERQGRILLGQSKGFLTYILSAPPAFHASLPILDRALEISSQYRIGVYDCVYVALAEQLGCDLITCDERLIANLQPHGFPVVSLGSL